MMRTVEVFLVIVVILGAFIISSYYTVLPTPRRVSPLNLERWAWTTLQILDSNFNLSAVVFKDPDDPVWDNIQAALSTLLPPNIVYNFTVYEVQNGTGGTLYSTVKSISNTENLGIQSEAASYLISSSHVSFEATPVQIGEKSKLGGTLYILNCSDARGWWITGYTAQSLAYDLHKLLSRYFKHTIMVNNTAQLEQLLEGNPLTAANETIMHAVIINTFGEAVPISNNHKNLYSGNGYADYCLYVGRRVRLYNWTWISIVGWPFYYVTNTVALKDSRNSYGIYGMVDVRAAGLHAFLQGLNNRTSYVSDSTDLILDEQAVSAILHPQIIGYCHRYGIYPSQVQTATRSIKEVTLSKYNLNISILIFQKDTTYNSYPGALYRHTSGSGSFLAIGITRTPDIRLTAIGVLAYYKPDIKFSIKIGEEGEILRLAVLQLGQVGGI